MKNLRMHLIYGAVILSSSGFLLGHVVELKIRMRSMERVIGSFIRVAQLSEETKRERDRMLRPVIKGKR